MFTLNHIIVYELKIIDFLVGWLVGWLVGFYGISIFIDYLTPNPFLYKNNSV